MGSARLRDLVLAVLIVGLVVSSVFAVKLSSDLAEQRGSEERRGMRVFALLLESASSSVSYVAYGAARLGEGDPCITRTYIQDNLYHASRYLELALIADPRPPKGYEEAIARTGFLLNELSYLLSSIHHHLVKDPDKALAFMHQNSEALSDLDEALARVAKDYMSLASSRSDGLAPTPGELMSHLSSLEEAIRGTRALAREAGIA